MMVWTFAAPWLTVAGVIYDINLGSRLWAGISNLEDFYLFYVFYGICTLGGKYLVLVYKLLEKKCIALK